MGIHVDFAGYGPGTNESGSRLSICLVPTRIIDASEECL